MAYCNKCGTQTMTMTGTIYLEFGAEPYEEGVEEEPRVLKDKYVEDHIIAHFCEKCNEVVETFNE